MTPPPFWDGILRRLEAEVPAFAVQAWLAPLVPEADGEGLVLLCPTPFHRDRVRDRYLPSIEASAAQEAGRPVSVSLGLGLRRAGLRLSQRTGGETPDVESATAAPPAALAGTARQTADSGANRQAADSGANRQTASDVATLRAGLGSTSLPESATVTASRWEPADAAAPSFSRPAPMQRVLPYSFESFVVGPCNALAREASLALAHGSQPGVCPLYIAGRPGLGKTHLARALAAEAQRHGLERTVYTSAESFTSEFLASIRAQKMPGFKRRFREQCDLLVIEDVQFLTGKKATQLELFHIVAHLLDAGSRVALTADREPRELTDLDPRLRSQITGGLVAVLEPPDARVRREILRQKAAAGGVRLPEGCLDRLVDGVHGSVRDLEGVLIQLVATASLLKCPIDLRLTEDALRKLPDAAPARPVLEISQVVGSVAAYFKTTPASLAARSRRRDVLVPRQLAMYLCRRYTDAPMQKIGETLGRDHPAVSHALKQVERAILERAPLRYQMEALVERLDALAGASGRR